jgi:glycosyltransferase involved in cell wall biosynthesis
VHSPDMGGRDRFCLASQRTETLAGDLRSSSDGSDGSHAQPRSRATSTNTLERIVDVWINGRFLTRPTTGVERVARGLVSALAKDFLDGDASLKCGQTTLRFRIAVPEKLKAKVPGSMGCIPVVGMGVHQGHLWEQIDLARLPKDDWLISLCNTGPLLRRNHGLMFHDAQIYAIPENFNWKFRLWYRVMLNVAGRRAAFLLTNSGFSQTEIARYTGIDKSRMTVVYPGVDHAQPDIKNDSSHEINRVPRQPFVLAVSSVNPNKNFGAVVRALELMGSDAPECVVVGPLNNKVFESAKLDLAKVTYLGYVSDETLNHLYQHALCLVFPSHYEGFGLPPVEAMLAGCPVIVSQTSCLPEVCGDAALYCDPAKPQTLADAIASLVHSPAQVALFRELGRQHAKQYTWHLAAAQMVERLKMAIESSKD